MEFINLESKNKSEFKSFLYKNKHRLLKHNYAIEREMLRILDFKNSPHDHPEVFGEKTRNKYITTDFAENQVEVITDQHKTIKEAIDFSEALYDIVACELKEDEILWPLSTPCDMNSPIKEASFEVEKENELYRKYLTNKYGKHRQMISGIHFNFSFDEEFLSSMYKFLNIDTDFKTFKNEIYLKTLNNYLYYQYLVAVFLSATPTAHESFGDTNGVYSIRNSKYGYHNLEDLKIDYTSVDKFVSSVRSAIDNQLIIDEREIYESIRIKNGYKFVTENLEETGIRYIEIRNIDINPYSKNGIDHESIQFIEIVLLYCLVSDLVNKDSIALEICNSQNIFEYSNVIIEDLKLISKFCQEYDLGVCSVINKFISQIETKCTLTTKVKNDIEKMGYRDFGYYYASRYLQDSKDNRFKFTGYEDLELSTQLLIREAVKYGIDVNIIDYHDNFIKLTGNGRVELVKQATKTSLDGYVNIMAMENKVVTKTILREHNIVVPDGQEFVNIEDACFYASMFEGGFVIKPKSTNFGIGISIFKDGANEEEIRSAVEFAFKYDNTILIEKFIPGDEYRFLVIDGKVSGVLNRVPANVIGDGSSTIEELVEIKNKNPLRGTNYSKPLEKIEIDEVAEIFLHQQGYNKQSILKDGEKVFLRENSNISTGGDSIDITDEVHNHFNELAIAATKAFDVVFCGVDIMIEDIKNPNSNYGIIEVNFNPAMHIHSFPYMGKERNIAKEILQALKLL